MLNQHVINIEMANSNINKKINILHLLYSFLTEHGIFIEKELLEYIEEYEFISVYILMSYMSSKKTKQGSKTNEHTRYFSLLFNQHVKEERIFDKLQYVYDKIKQIVLKIDSKYFAKQRTYDKFVKDYNLLTLKFNEISGILITEGKETYDTCDVCHVKMKSINSEDFDFSTGEIVCGNCGLTKPIINDIDENVIINDHLIKKPTYDTIKHLKYWIDRICGKECIEIPQKVISDVKQSLIQHGITNKNKITCEVIRDHLRCTKHSSYNEHVPLIRKKITGIDPPFFTEDELLSISECFARIIKIFRSLNIKKIHLPYSPFWIYKLTNLIVKDEKRKKDILSCIHLQSKETLINNDRLFKKIEKRIDVRILPFFKYEPTQRVDI
jgi:hypothetical protein